VIGQAFGTSGLIGLSCRVLSGTYGVLVGFPLLLESFDALTFLVFAYLACFRLGADDFHGLELARETRCIRPGNGNSIAVLGDMSAAEVMHADELVLNVLAQVDLLDGTFGCFISLFLPRHFLCLGIALRLVRLLLSGVLGHLDLLE
jgi:hypothetical protein